MQLKINVSILYLGIIIPLLFIILKLRVLKNNSKKKCVKY